MTFAINQHRQGEPEHHKTWITTLLSEYYDPMYDYQLAQRERQPIFQGDERGERIYNSMAEGSKLTNARLDKPALR